jgi:chemotaxis protein histidine kinase CheA
MDLLVDPRRFLEAYLEEASEHLEAALLRLEASPNQIDHVDEIFRAAHCIKGGAATFGLPEIALAAENARFVRGYLAGRGIRLVGERLGGTRALEAHFSTSTGRLRCREVVT